MRVFLQWVLGRDVQSRADPASTVAQALQIQLAQMPFGRQVQAEDQNGTAARVGELETLQLEWKHLSSSIFCLSRPVRNDTPSIKRSTSGSRVL
jgi:hypothetical protein